MLSIHTEFHPIWSSRRDAVASSDLEIIDGIYCTSSIFFCKKNKKSISIDRSWPGLSETYSVSQKCIDFVGLFNLENHAQNAPCISKVARNGKSGRWNLGFMPTDKLGNRKHEPEILDRQVGTANFSPIRIRLVQRSTGRK